MIIFGTRRTVQQLAMVLLTCGTCHHTAANALLKIVTKFTLFFVPLFPIRTRYAVQCTACGSSGQIDKDRAEQMRASGPPAPSGFAGPAPGSGMPQPPYPGPSPYGGQPPYLGQQAYPGQAPYSGQPPYPGPQQYPGAR
jgi:hypothetical protein